MHYIFIINSISFGDNNWTANEIMQFLLNRNMWAFSFNAPNLRKMDTGDKIIIYLAGKGNRCFVADCSISSKPYEGQHNSEEPDWMNMFPLRIDIKDIDIWLNPLPIANVLKSLEFIKDKKNYGLYLRQSTKEIDEKDFLEIIKCKA